MNQAFKCAVPLGLLDRNYAAAIIPKRRPKDKPAANRPWKEEEIAFVLGKAPPHVLAPVALMLNTGLDPKDALLLRKDQIKDGHITGVRAKTSVDVDLPIIEPLQRALDGMPRHDAQTLLVSSKGTAWTYRGMSNAWCKWRHEQYEAGFLADDLTHKGLRHTVATILREEGASLRNIA